MGPCPPLDEGVEFATLPLVFGVWPWNKVDRIGGAGFKFVILQLAGKINKRVSLHCLEPDENPTHLTFSTRVWWHLDTFWTCARDCVFFLHQQGSVAGPGWWRMVHLLLMVLVVVEVVVEGEASFVLQ